MSFSDRNVLPNLLSQYQFIHLNIGGAKNTLKSWLIFHLVFIAKIPNQKVLV